MYSDEKPIFDNIHRTKIDVIHVFAEVGAETSILKTLMQIYAIKSVFMTVEAQPLPLAITLSDHMSDGRRLIVDLYEALESKSKMDNSIILHAPSTNFKKNLVNFCFWWWFLMEQSSSLWLLFIIFKIGEDSNKKTVLTILSSFQPYPLLSACLVNAPMLSRVDDIWPIAGDKFYVVVFDELRNILNKANDEGKPEPVKRILARL